MVTTLDLPRKCNILSSTSLPQHQWLARPSSFPTLLNGNNHKKVDLQLLSPTFPYFWASSFYFLPPKFLVYVFLLKDFFWGDQNQMAPSASPGGGRTLRQSPGTMARSNLGIFSNEIQRCATKIYSISKKITTHPFGNPLNPTMKGIPWKRLLVKVARGVFHLDYTWNLFVL